MNENSKYNNIFSNIILYLIIILIIKVIWSFVFFIFLPKKGQSYEAELKENILFYRVKIAHKIVHKKSIIIKKKKKRKSKRRTKSRNIDSITNLILLGIYRSFNKEVITVKYKNKTHILVKGDHINKFIFDSAGYNYAVFLKNNKAYRILIQSRKSKKKSKYKKDKRIKKVQDPNKNIIFSNNEIPIIPKLLLKEYTQDINKAWNNIGISDYVKNSKIAGFRINYIKRGSDFERIGLKRGDILKSINGETLDNYNIAFSFYKKINSLDDITIVIERNNQEMELEYEIK